MPSEVKVVQTIIAVQWHNRENIMSKTVKFSMTNFFIDFKVKLKRNVAGSITWRD